VKWKSNAKVSWLGWKINVVIYFESEYCKNILGDDEYARRAQEKRYQEFLIEESRSRDEVSRYDNSGKSHDFIVTYYNTVSTGYYYADDETEHSNETEEQRYQRQYREAIRRSLEDQERALQHARSTLPPVKGSGKWTACKIELHYIPLSTGEEERGGFKVCRTPV